MADVRYFKIYHDNVDRCVKRYELSIIRKRIISRARLYYRGYNHFDDGGDYSIIKEVLVMKKIKTGVCMFCKQYGAHDYAYHGRGKNAIINYFHKECYYKTLHPHDYILRNIEAHDYMEEATE